jgi:hypothetical protein
MIFSIKCLQVFGRKEPEPQIVISTPAPGGNLILAPWLLVQAPQHRLYQYVILSRLFFSPGSNFPMKKPCFPITITAHTHCKVLFKKLTDTGTPKFERLRYHLFGFRPVVFETHKGTFCLSLF